jgi:hypothetical protein
MDQTTEELVSQAEESARADQAAIVESLQALADRARAHRDTCKRLADVARDAEKLEAAIRSAVDALGNGTGPRKPVPEQGEARDDDLARRVAEARKGEAA